MQSSPASEQNGPPGPGIEDLQARVDELDDRYRRALADLDNYRKRSERLADSRVADARDRMLRDWLDAVDSVETALDMTSSDGELEGLKAVRDQMRSILERQGVQRFGAAGERLRSRSARGHRGPGERRRPRPVDRRRRPSRLHGR